MQAGKYRFGVVGEREGQSAWLLRLIQGKDRSLAKESSSIHSHIPNSVAYVNKHKRYVEGCIEFE